MITNLFQSLGILFSILICVAVTAVVMYLSYILGIGLVIASLLFVIYHIVSLVRRHK